MTMNLTHHPARFALAALPVLVLSITGCEPPKAQSKGLPPAYTSNQITDPALRKIADEIRTWVSEQKGAGKQALYSKTEVLPPVPIVQPYGVGVFQHEVRLSVILTTGPGWPGLESKEKEDVVANAYREISGRLLALDHKPPLPLTLTIQTPQGMELSWINHLDSTGNHVHGDE